MPSCSAPAPQLAEVVSLERVAERWLAGTADGRQWRARRLLNAAGAWADRLRTGTGAPPLLRPLRGSHLVVPFWRLPVAQSISFMHPQDGRPVFLYPWEGATLIGTTDLDHHAPLDAEARITAAEVDYLIEAVNDQFPATHLRPADVVACYAGVRPVLDDGQKDASKATRDHVVLQKCCKSLV